MGSITLLANENCTESGLIFDIHSLYGYCFRSFQGLWSCSNFTDYSDRVLVRSHPGTHNATLVLAVWSVLLMRYQLVTLIRLDNKTATRRVGCPE